jgi:hypothetical protein
LPASPAAAGRGAFQADCDVHAVAVELVVVDHQVTEVEADAEHDGGVRRLMAIGVDHRLLDLDGGAQRFDGARELDHGPIARELDQPAAVTPHGGLDAFHAMRLEAEVRPAFIAAHQAGIAHDVDAHDRRQASHDLFAGLHGPPNRRVFRITT